MPNPSFYVQDNTDPLPVISYSPPDTNLTSNYTSHAQIVLIVSALSSPGLASVSDLQPQTIHDVVHFGTLDTLLSSFLINSIS